MDRLRRLPEVARVLRAGRRLLARDEWSIEQLRAHRRKRLLAIVRHAAASSPYYRERFADIELSDDLELTALPTLDKATMLENFDDLVTDRRLSLAGVEAHLEELERSGPRADPKLLGEYRAMASGGSSGRRGVFLYGREEWIEALASGARVSWGYLGQVPRLPRRRFTTIWAEGPRYITGRMLRTFDLGVSPVRQQRLDARMALGELVDALNAFQPEWMNAYASTAAQLAEQQLAGALRISPRVVVTSAEVRTPEMEQQILAAWGRAPFNVYISTESGTPIAAECEHHAGLHLFEDCVQIEVVDDDGRPVPIGEPGSRLLLTNLFNRTQPLIRYELDDLVTVSRQACPCGRPFPLLKSVEGRSDDILELPTSAGATVKVNPLTLESPMTGTAAVSEYRILYASGELRVEVVLNGSGDRGPTCGEIEGRLAAAIAESGARVPPIRIESVAEIPRNPHSGKRKAIEVQATRQSDRA
jgi:phenylacetate-coenzyme A ligase PaaK-like adenylate-forming protein